MSIEIFSDNGLIRRFWKYVEKKSDNECWLWKGGKKPKGYGSIGLTKSTKTITSHRLSFMIHNKREIAPNTMILHSCDNPSCVNPNHLREGTAQDNTNDAKERGRITLGRKKGEEHQNSVLTVEQVLEIYHTSLSHKKAAAQYKVSARLVFNIKHGLAWKHVTNHD